MSLGGLHFKGLIFGILCYLLAAIRHQDTVLKSPLIIHSALILCRSLYLSHVFICSTLYPPGSCANFEPGPLLKTSKGPAKLIANCVFFHTVLLQTVAEIAHVCLTLGRGHI